MYNSLREFLKLSANEDRFRIMFLLFQADLCVCQLSHILKLSQPTVSKNLSKLRDTHFVDATRDGKFTFYSFKTEDISVNVFLEDIIKHLENYPKLRRDSQGLVKKDECLICINK